MIKRIRFATMTTGVDARSFSAAWRLASGEAARAPRELRPRRIVICPGLADFLDDRRHDGVGIEWFTDEAHLERFDAWAAGPGGRSLLDRLGAVVSLPDSPVMVAEEVVLRGAEWLRSRWSDGGDRIKHMAVARRADDLTPEAFSERWRGRAGAIATTSGQTIAIPDEARGRAYVQNHPLAAPAPGWHYDAVNEVYLDDEVSLRARADWFARNLRGGAERDLISEWWFIAARETIVYDAGVEE